MVVHEMLAAHLPNYQVETYSPKWEYLLPLMPLIKPSHADILHTAPDHGVLLVRRRQRFVATFHGFMLDSGLRPYNTFVQSLHYRTDLRFLVSRALARADVVTAVSQFTAGMVREELGFHGHIEVVPNAVDTQMFHPGSEPRESDRFVALFAGNNSLHKGVQWLPSIANRLDQHITIRCIGARDQYRGMGRGIEVLPGVRRSSMPDIYRSADLLLLPTVREGMSLAILEAMATGLPVVATRCSSIPEYVHDGRGGILCEVGDVDCFAAAINRLAGDAELRRGMGEYNRKLVCERFNLPGMVHAYGQIFERLQ